MALFFDSNDYLFDIDTSEGCNTSNPRNNTSVGVVLLIIIISIIIFIINFW